MNVCFHLFSQNQRSNTRFFCLAVPNRPTKQQFYKYVRIYKERPTLRRNLLRYNELSLCSITVIADGVLILRGSNFQATVEAFTHLFNLFHIYTFDEKDFVLCEENCKRFYWSLFVWYKREILLFNKQCRCSGIIDESNVRRLGSTPTFLE